MTERVDVQIASELAGLPRPESIREWVAAALLESHRDDEMTVRIVDRDEIVALNRDYRGKEGATNVLAFPADVPPGTGVRLLGDVIVCAPVVVAEAVAQGKKVDSHWAHLVVHGTLHLQGFDHENPAEAGQMETREVDILARLGYSNPYETGNPVANPGRMTPPQ